MWLSRRAYEPKNDMPSNGFQCLPKFPGFLQGVQHDQAPGSEVPACLSPPFVLGFFPRSVVQFVSICFVSANHVDPLQPFAAFLAWIVSLSTVSPPACVCVCVAMLSLFVFVCLLDLARLHVFPPNSNRVDTFVGRRMLLQLVVWKDKCDVCLPTIPTPEEAADLLLDKQKALEVRRLLLDAQVCDTYATHMQHMLLESARSLQRSQVFWQKIYKPPEAFKENKAWLRRQEIYQSGIQPLIWLKRIENGGMMGYADVCSMQYYARIQIEDVRCADMCRLFWDLHISTSLQALLKDKIEQAQALGKEAIISGVHILVISLDLSGAIQWPLKAGTSTQDSDRYSRILKHFRSF